MNDLLSLDTMEVKTPGGKSAMGVSNVDTPLDVAIQDQHSDIVDVYACEHLGNVTLAVPTVSDTRVVTLVAGHGMQAEEVLCIKNDTSWYQGRVISVNGNDITLNQPINTIYPVTTPAFRTSSVMRVNGSVSRRIFSVFPPAQAKWDITRMFIVLRDDATMDDGKFGALNALTNGVMFRVKKSATHWNNLFNARTNSEFAIRCSSAEYVPAAQGPSGQSGFRAIREFNGFDKNGVTIRLDGSDPNSKIEIIVQDNLEGLTYFSVVFQGHVVED